MTPQKIQELATLNLSEVAIKAQDGLAHFSPNVELEVINSASTLRNYPAHQRLVQIKKIGHQIQVCLINEHELMGKAAIRKIYEQRFNWQHWLKTSLEKAEHQGYSLTGYYCIDYVIQQETYLGESWEEACQHFRNISLD